MQELDSLRNEDRWPGQDYHQNTNIDYSQAIRELNQKNMQLRNQLQGQRVNRSSRKANIDQERHRQLMRQYEELQNRNLRMKRELGYA